jgi:hypothetical protein
MNQEVKHHLQRARISHTIVHFQAKTMIYNNNSINFASINIATPMQRPSRSNEQNFCS